MRLGKKVVYIVPAVLLTGMLAACGGSGASSASSVSAVSEETVTETPTPTPTPTPVATPTPTPAPTPKTGGSIKAEAIESEPAEEEAAPDSAENEAGTEASASEDSGAYRTVSAVNVRETPDLDGEIYTSLEPGTEVTVLGEESGWYIVSVDGGTYYISQELLERSSGSNTVQEAETDAGEEDLSGDDDGYEEDYEAEEVDE